MTQFSFANFLLNQTNVYNGHFQATISGMSVEDALLICKELEDLTESMFVVELWSDGSYTIYQKDFWKVGQRLDGQTDRMILSVENN